MASDKNVAKYGGRTLREIYKNTVATPDIKWWQAGWDLLKTGAHYTAGLVAGRFGFQEVEQEQYSAGYNEELVRVNAARMEMAKEKFETTRSDMKRGMREAANIPELVTVLSGLSPGMSDVDSNGARRRWIDTVMNLPNLSISKRNRLLRFGGTGWNELKKYGGRYMSNLFTAQMRRAVSGRMGQLNNVYATKNLGGVIRGRFGMKAAADLEELIGSGGLSAVRGGLDKVINDLGADKLRELGGLLDAQGGIGGETVGRALYSAANVKKIMDSSRLSKGQFSTLFGRVFGARWQAGSKKVKNEAYHIWNKKAWTEEDAKKFSESMGGVIGEDEIKDIVKARMAEGGKVTEKLKKEFASKAASGTFFKLAGTTNEDMMNKGSQAKFFGSGPGIHAELKRQTGILFIIAASNDKLAENFKKELKKLGQGHAGSGKNSPSGGK